MITAIAHRPGMRCPPFVGRGCASAMARCRYSARFLPLALHGALGQTVHRADFREREAAKELEVDDLGERGIHARQLVERIADVLQLGLVGDRVRHSRCRGPSSRTGRRASARGCAYVVDDETAHRPRRIGQEPGAVGKHHPLASRHVEVRFVQQRRRAERHVTAVAAPLRAWPSGAARRKARQRALLAVSRIGLRAPTRLGGRPSVRPAPR